MQTSEKRGRISANPQPDATGKIHCPCLGKTTPRHVSAGGPHEWSPLAVRRHTRRSHSAGTQKGGACNFLCFRKREPCDEMGPTPDVRPPSPICASPDHLLNSFSFAHNARSIADTDAGGLKARPLLPYNPQKMSCSPSPRTRWRAFRNDNSYPYGSPAPGQREKTRVMVA